MKTVDFFNVSLPQEVGQSYLKLLEKGYFLVYYFKEGVHPEKTVYTIYYDNPFEIKRGKRELNFYIDYDYAYGFNVSREGWEPKFEDDNGLFEEEGIITPLFLQGYFYSKFSAEVMAEYIVKKLGREKNENEKE